MGEGRRPAAQQVRKLRSSGRRHRPQVHKLCGFGHRGWRRTDVLTSTPRGRRIAGNTDRLAAPARRPGGRRGYSFRPRVPIKEGRGARGETPSQEGKIRMTLVVLLMAGLLALAAVLIVREALPSGAARQPTPLEEYERRRANPIWNEQIAEEFRRRTEENFLTYESDNPLRDRLSIIVFASLLVWLQNRFAPRRP